MVPSAGPPVIEGGLPRYRPGDLVNVTCTTGKSKPAADLYWYINGEPVSLDSSDGRARFPENDPYIRNSFMTWKVNNFVSNEKSLISGFTLYSTYPNTSSDIRHFYCKVCLFTNGLLAFVLDMYTCVLCGMAHVCSFPC